MSFLDKFNYQIFGSPQAPKLVFLHGLMGAGANWRKILRDFESHFQILIFDQRGHGRSFQPEGSYSPEEYAEDLRHILDELGWEKVLLVGHSMGGRNAMAFAHLFPHRVDGLVVEDIGPTRLQSGVSQTEHLLSLVPRPFASRAEAKKFFMGEFVEKIKHNPQAKTLAQYFYTNVEEKQGGRVDWRFSLEGVLKSLQQGRAKERWQQWERFNLPILLIRGQNSTELPHDMFQEMLKRNPKAVGVEIVDAGHWVHSDQPQKFSSALLQFFRSIGFKTE